MTVLPQQRRARARQFWPRQGQWRCLLALVALAGMVLVVPARAQYTIDWSVMGNGGGTGTGNVYRVDATIGQPVVSSVLTSGSETTVDGFWGGFWTGSVFTSVAYGANLLANPGAELGIGSLDGTVVETVPGWVTTGNFTAAQYGTASQVNNPPPGPGTNYFAGGPNNAQSAAQQAVNVSSLAADIDAGNDSCAIGGWLAGFSSDDDNAVFTANFLDAAGHTNGSVWIGPVQSADRTSTTAFLNRLATQPLPPGTRSILCTLVMTRLNGSYNDGYADNLSLVISNTPPPLVPPTVSLNANLLVNADAELGAGSTNVNVVEPVPGWMTSGNFTVGLYSSAFGVTPAQPGPPGRGSQFFYGGHASGNSLASQDINVAARTSDIDTGSLICNLAGWLGGFQNQNDNARLTASFLDANGQSIGSLGIGPLLAADRTNITQMLFRSAATRVPAGTRTIRCVLSMTWVDFSYNDGTADNLSLSLSPTTPLPLPPLTMTNSGASHTFSWPIVYGSWILQSSTNLGVNPIVWTDVLPPYQTNGGTVSWQTNASTLPAQFFRLRP